jgi:Tfp pilus assembly protein PilV
MPVSADRGASLVEVLVSIVLLGVAGIAVLTALAATTVGARTHREVAVQWEIEELTHKRSTPCTSNLDVSMPVGVGAGVDAVSLRCVAVADVDGHPAALLEASATSGRGVVSVAALVQVPRTQYVTNVLRWSVD